MYIWWKNKGPEWEGVVRTYLLTTERFGTGIKELMDNSRVTGSEASVERTQESEELRGEVRLEKGNGLGAEVTSGVEDDRDKFRGRRRDTNVLVLLCFCRHLFCHQRLGGLVLERGAGGVIDRDV